MKIDILIVDLAVVAMVVLPYVLFILMSSGEARKLKRKFLLESRQHLSKTDEVLSWNQVMIGIDRSRQKLLLVQRLNADFRVEVLDLKHFFTSEVKTTFSSVPINGMVSEILERIDLEFSGPSGGKVGLNLFNHNLTFRQDFELKNAEKANKLIQACLSFRPIINSAA